MASQCQNLVSPRLGKISLKEKENKVGEKVGEKNGHPDRRKSSFHFESRFPFLLEGGWRPTLSAESLAIFIAVTKLCLR